MKNSWTALDTPFLGRKAIKNKVTGEICLKLKHGEIWPKNDKEVKILFYENSYNIYRKVCKKYKLSYFSGKGERIITLTNSQAVEIIPLLESYGNCEKQIKEMSGGI